jgi:putative ABC transport system permease protein
VRDVRDLLGVALGGLSARKMRTALILLGPILGVGMIVASVGFTSSAKGDLQRTLRALGTNLVECQASSAFGTEDPRLPEDVVGRVNGIDAIDEVAPVLAVQGVLTLPYPEAESFYEAFPVPVLAADTTLPAVLDVPMLAGRWLDTLDENPTRAAVIGRDLAAEYNYLHGEARTILLNGIEYGVIGVLDTSPLVASMNTAVFISFAAAEEDFVDEVEPTTVYVRATPGFEQPVATALPTAISLGGPDSAQCTVPSELLEAQAETDTQLQTIVAVMGGLALLVGAVGIANVMTISVIQRSAEIGIRRALGHTRATIAWQFLIEAVVIGLFGGALGAMAGAGVLWIGVQIKGWVYTIDPGVFVLGMGSALLMSVVAGIYPSTKAAHLEPLETLRLG